MFFVTKRIQTNINWCISKITYSLKQFTLDKCFNFSLYSSTVYIQLKQLIKTSSSDLEDFWKVFLPVIGADIWFGTVPQHTNLAQKRTRLQSHIFKADRIKKKLGVVSQNRFKVYK